MIEISLNNKETVQPPKAAKRTKTQRKNQQHLDHKLARPYSKDLLDLKQSVIKWVSILLG